MILSVYIYIVAQRVADCHPQRVVSARSVRAINVYIDYKNPNTALLQYKPLSTRILFGYP
jgi:hypothetical protein